MQALKRVPWKKRRAKAQEWARLSHESRRRNMAERGVNADTDRARTLDDARGQIIASGATYTAEGVTSWQVVRSVAGAVNQIDVVKNGVTVATGGMRDLRRAMKRAKITEKSC